MSQNITDFYTQVQNKDFARQHQFRISDWSVNNTVLIDDTDMVYLESGALPGRAINNVQVPFMGLNFNIPGNANYPGSDAYSVTFRCDQAYDLRAKLEAATFKTFNDQSSAGEYNIGTSSLLTLNLLGKQTESIRTYTLYGAWVVSIGESTYNLGDNGAIQTLPITLAYQFWRPTSKGTTGYDYASSTGLNKP